MINLLSLEIKFYIYEWTGWRKLIHVILSSDLIFK